MGEKPRESCDGLIAPAEEAVEPPPINDGEDEDVDQEAGGAEPLRKAASPTMPSAADGEEHRLTHVPFRSWCTECCLARGHGEQRGAHAGRAHDIPIVGVDFCYISTGRVKRCDELKDSDEELKDARENGKMVKCLIVR